MKIIYLQRGAGKTTKMIEWYLEKPNERILLVISQFEKMRIAGILKEKGEKLAHQSILTFNDLDRLRGYTPELELGIDNLDYFVHHLFEGKYGKHISIVSLSEDNNL